MEDVKMALAEVFEEKKSEMEAWVEHKIEQHISKRVTPIQDVKVMDTKAKPWAIQALILAKSRKERWDLDKTCAFYGVSKEKVLSAGTFSAGGALIEETFAQEIIDMLREDSVYLMAKPNIRQIPSGNVTIPIQLTSTTLNWIGETQNIPVTEPTFGQVTLSMKKGAILVPISNDLLRTASINVAEIVQKDILTSLSLGLDDTLIYSGTGTSYTPKSLANFASASGTVWNQTGGSNFTVANINTDIYKAKKAAAKAKAKMVRPAWFMTASTKIGLASQLNTSSDKVAWAREIEERGTLTGIPIYTTSVLQGTGVSTVLLVDMNEVIFGQTGNIELEFLENAAYFDGSQVVSGFSSDQSAFRAIIHVDQQVAHPETLVRINNVYWGE